MASTCESDMDHSTTTTPPATPSRASTLPTASVERSSISMEPPRMDSQSNSKLHPHAQDSIDFNPTQMLMQTPITIECGPNLKTQLTLHEEILCCHSKQLQDRFTKAKSLRGQYTNASFLRNKVAQYVFPEITTKEFEDKRCEQQVISLIKQAFENYPLSGYASHVKKSITGAVEEQINAKNTKKPGPKPAHDLSLHGKLSLLKARSVQMVAQELYSTLHAINKSEVTKAQTEPLKAAAQQRLLLPDIEGATVRSFTQWIYRGTFTYEGSEQLYAVQKLATQLGVEPLASICLTQLYNAANDSLQRASAQGVSLQTLLGYGADATTDDIIGVVFKHAVKDKNTPKQLKSLVIDTLAASLDTELWQHVKDLVNHGMALQVIEAMIELRQHVKTEMYEQESIKSESEDTSSASIQSTNPVDDEKPSHVGEHDGAHA